MESPTIALPANSPRISRAMVLLTVVGPFIGLAYYKWSSAARTLTSVHKSGQWSSSVDGLIAASSAIGSSSFYVGKIAIALAFGVAVAAGLEAFAIPALIEKLGRSGATTAGQLLAAASGMPLMLCSCCVTPVFGAMQRGGVTLRNALTLMLASPTINPAALVLTIMLFPTRVVLARFAGAAVIVFLLPRVAEAVDGGRTLANPILVNAGEAYEPQPSNAGIGRRYFASLWNVIAHTPVLVPGILLSALLIQHFGRFAGVQSSSTLAIAALAITLIALPTYFEIPLALLALHSGGDGLAAAVLIAGPAVNLPSLFVVWREVSAKVALVVGLGVGLTATVIALVAA